MQRIRTYSAPILAAVFALGLASCATNKPRSSSYGSASDQVVGLRADDAKGPLKDRGFNTEEYGRITENEFLEVANDPVSTFSIDVDTASYSNVRRFISQGQLPPADAVRIEELINYFKYAYPQPEADNPFSITTELAACPWNREHKLVHIGLQGRSLTLEDAPPNNLVFLIDSSGSMDSPDKLPLLKSAFKLLTDQLRRQDRVAIVTYAGAAGLVLPSTSGSNKEEITAALD